MADGTGVFKPLEIQALNEVLDDYHAQNHGLGHRSATFEQDGAVAGFAYVAPAAMTDRTWYLYWIAVHKQIQARGMGAALLHMLRTWFVRPTAVFSSSKPRRCRTTADPPLLPQARLRTARRDPRLLRRRRQHGDFPQAYSTGKSRPARNHSRLALSLLAYASCSPFKSGRGRLIFCRRVQVAKAFKGWIDVCQLRGLNHSGRNRLEKENRPQPVLREQAFHGIGYLQAVNRCQRMMKAPTWGTQIR